MNSILNKNRDSYVDFLRGAAMLLVVFGHTMTGLTNHSQSSVVYNIVWSLQMPLFILISGYVTRYGRTLSTARDLLRLLLRRTVAYLLPWCVFTILFNGVILKKQELNADALFWHMDSGYWFLITIWTISIIFAISQLAAVKLCRREKMLPLAVLCFYLIGMAILAGIGYWAGLNFFCIKLTLYYMPFYFLGYIFGLYHEKIKKRLPSLIPIIVAVSVVLWIVAIVKLNIYELSDTRTMDILLRVGISLSGCIGVCGLLKAVKSASLIYRGVNWFGRHSIEVFLLHYYFLNLITFAVKPDFFTARGMALITVNYVITVTVVAVTVKLMSSNRYLNLMLFGKPAKLR